VSLEAVVYKNPEKIKLLFPNLSLSIDMGTGESYLSDDVNVTDHPSSDFAIAKQQWLGNLNSIATVRSALSGYELHSPIIDRIIASGSQSGDYIAVLEFPLLKAEIETYLKLKPDASVVEFLKNMSNLLKTGETENNSIVLV